MTTTKAFEITMSFVPEVLDDATRYRVWIRRKDEATGKFRILLEGSIAKDDEERVARRRKGVRKVRVSRVDARRVGKPERFAHPVG